MKLQTYLHFDGTCEQAMDFYKEILEGEITMQMRFKDAPEEICKTLPDEALELIMHCTLQCGDAIIMASDYVNEHEQLNQGNNFAVSINVDDEGKGADIFAKLSAGGMTMMPFEEAFWGGKFGMLLDKFGVHWMISGPHGENK